MEIHWRNTAWLADDEREKIETSLRDLSAQGHEDLIDIRITCRPSRHQGHAPHEIHIACEARGKEVVVVDAGERMSKTLHDALGTFKQQVRKMRDRRAS